MLDDKTFTLAEAHKHFAIKSNGEAWHLLEIPDRKIFLLDLDSGNWYGLK